MVDLHEYSKQHPLSLCKCGHTGDGANSQHGDFYQKGHGECTLCLCSHFHWVGWTPEVENLLAEEDE